MVPSYDAIAKLVNFKGHLSDGVDAKFMPLNDNFGFKFYADRARAVICYMRQKWAMRHQLAPSVGDFTCFDYRGHTFHGFVTKRLRMPSDKEYIEKIGAGSIWGFVPYGHALITGLASIGFRATEGECDTFDLHIKNVGFNEDNIVLPIDFGWGDVTGSDWTLDNTDMVAILKKNNLTQEEFIRA